MLEVVQHRGTSVVVEQRQHQRGAIAFAGGRVEHGELIHVDGR